MGLKNMKSMVLKSVLASALLVCVPVAQAVPPFFKHERNNCWLDAVVQLLYNIREFVEYVIKNEKTLIQKLDKEMGSQIAAFAALAREIQKKPSQQHALATLHQAVDLDAYNSRSMTDPIDLLVPVLGDSILGAAIWDLLLVSILKWDAQEQAKQECASKPLGAKRDQCIKEQFASFAELLAISLGRVFMANCLQPLGAQLKEAKIDFLGKYFVVSHKDAPEIWVEKLVANRAAPVPLKLVIDGHEFELITVLVTQVGYHHWAYIKDQWEKDPSWWLCYGLNHKPEPIASKEIEAKINAEWDSSKKVARYLVYKLVESPLKTALKNLSDSLEALRGQLVPKK